MDACRPAARRERRPLRPPSVRASARAGAGAYDDPEHRPLGERCICRSAHNARPADAAELLLQQHYQIVQTQDTSMILDIEMVHDARIIRIDGKHRPDNVRKWTGDSVGHWEGDTLVVDTTNFTDRELPRLEREPEGDRALHARRAQDRCSTGSRSRTRTVWDTPWSGEYEFAAADDQIYEYACHEGNYALGDILRGAG